MRISPQVYVKGSLEAAALYCEAFGATRVLEILDDTGQAYAHCELARDGGLFLAVSEAPPECDTSPRTTWQRMAFNVFDVGDEQAVRHAVAVLSEGGTMLDELGPCDWNPFCANVVDRFGVFWWVAF
ncbi:VOC family protein [Cellulomonas soli]